mmetsp:Transcript_50457/g.110353  ORF Transcript_50457/g.110353 Transcript_50457/m.110353 type:complete len:280 (-) Transcript_50457:173-1012(-)
MKQSSPSNGRSPNMPCWLLRGVGCGGWDCRQSLSRSGSFNTSSTDGEPKKRLPGLKAVVIGGASKGTSCTSATDQSELSAATFPSSDATSLAGGRSRMDGGRKLSSILRKKIPMRAFARCSDHTDAWISLGRGSRGTASLNSITPQVGEGWVAKFVSVTTAAVKRSATSKTASAKSSTRSRPTAATRPQASWLHSASDAADLRASAPGNCARAQCSDRKLAATKVRKFGRRSRSKQPSKSSTPLIRATLTSAVCSSLSPSMPQEPRFCKHESTLESMQT